MSRTPYLTVKEAVAYLNLGSRAALYRLINQHRLPFCRVGHKYRFDQRELDAWAHGFPSAIEQLRSERRRSA